MAQFLFGGTFDPPHFGHSRIIEQLLSLGPKDAAITVLPSCHPPAKNPPLLGFAQRVALCELAFLPLDSRVAVSRIEAALTPPSYFIHTVKALYGDKPKDKPKERPIMVIGFDQLRSLHLWHQAQELFKAVDIWVVDRSSEDHQDGQDRALIAQQLARFGVSLPDAAPLAEPFCHAYGVFRYVPFAQPQSSTAIRRQLSSGQLEKVRDWLHPDVYARLTDPQFLSAKDTHGSQ